MSDTLLEPEDQTGEHQVTKSGNCVIAGCPCRGWSAEESVKEVSECQSDHPWANCPKCGIGICGEHMTTWLNHQPHQPAAQGGGEEWYSVISRVAGYVWHDNKLVASCGNPDDADRIVTEHNQHQALVAERERLIIAAKAVVERLADLPRYLEKNGTDALATMTAECLADLAVAIPAEQRSTSE